MLIGQKDMQKAIFDAIKSTKPCYVYFDQMKNYRHVSEVPDECFIGEYKKPSWGHGIYTVNEDGSLKLLEHDFDTSD